MNENYGHLPARTLCYGCNKKVIESQWIPAMRVAP